jgi:hypothetical protein
MKVCSPALYWKTETSIVSFTSTICSLNGED